MGCSVSAIPLGSNNEIEQLRLPDPRSLGKIRLPLEPIDEQVELSRGMIAAWRSNIVATAPPTAASRLAPLSSPQRSADVYFHTEHTACPPIRMQDTFNGAVGSALLSLLAEAEQGFPHANYDLIRTFHALRSARHFRLAAGHAAEADAPPSTAVAPTEAALQKSPVRAAVIHHPSLRRWVRLHGVFFVLTQALIALGNTLIESLDKHEFDNARDTMTMIAMFLDATSSAFRLATAFPRNDYITIIRPSMVDCASDTFSGTDQIDHSTLLSNFRTQRPRLAVNALQLGDTINIYRAALSASYDSHALICERFVGDNPSLLQGSSSVQSAPKILRTRLKPRALATLGLSHQK